MIYLVKINFFLPNSYILNSFIYLFYFCWLAITLFFTPSWFPVEPNYLCYQKAFRCPLLTGHQGSQCVEFWCGNVGDSQPRGAAVPPPGPWAGDPGCHCGPDNPAGPSIKPAAPCRQAVRHSGTLGCFTDWPIPHCTLILDQQIE